MAREQGRAAGPLCGVVCALLSAVASAPARAEPPVDPSRIFTLQVENDATAGTDRYYTSGIRLGLTLPTGTVPDAISSLGHNLFGDGRQRIALGLSQLLFTPRDTQINPPDPHDRPYAGLLLGSATLIQDTDLARSTLGIDLGVIGPAALGKEVQNSFHRLIGEHGNLGWGSQLPNQPVLELTASRTWRLAAASLGPLETDFLPAVAAGIGTWRDYALAGVQVRLGQGLDGDFGAPRIPPGLNGADAYLSTRALSWYVFAGADGQVVAYDETINGEPFRHTAHVSLTPLVAEMQFGIAVMVFGMRLSFTDVLRTHEFRGQSGGLFQFGSAAISFKF